MAPTQSILLVPVLQRAVWKREGCSFRKYRLKAEWCLFIVIQYLSPDYKSMMVELLSKHTAMPVRRAEEGMFVEAGSVYLIPPKKNLSIFHGKLLLSEFDHSRGHNLPADVFMCSLADDQAGKAIGVVLSGTGGDGVRGIRAIKEAGGMIMAQSGESAKFDGMLRDWRRKDGSLFPVLTRFSPLDLANLNQGTILTVLDLSRSTQAVEQTRVSEERYRQLFNSMAEGVVYHNVNGEIISANPAAASILGLPADEMNSQTSLGSCWKTICEDGPEFPSGQHPSMIALQTGQPMMSVFNPQRDQPRWRRVSAIPLFNTGGKNHFRFSQLSMTSLK